MFRLFKLSIMTVATLMMLYTLSGAESIFEVQYTSAPGSGNDCYPSPKNGATVTLEGVVTGIMQGSYPYFFIQHPDSTTWNGVYIYDADVNPQLGDSVRVRASIRILWIDRTLQLDQLSDNRQQPRIAGYFVDLHLLPGLLQFQRREV